MTRIGEETSDKNANDKTNFSKPAHSIGSLERQPQWFCHYAICKFGE